MNREKVKELLKKRSTKVGSVVLAAAIVISGSMWAWRDSRNTVPELVTYVDMAGDVTIEEEDTPLAAPKVTTKTKKKTKKIKLKKAATKTYSTKKTSSKVKNKNSSKSKTEIKTVTEVVDKYTKGQKVMVRETTTTTTTTVTAVEGKTTATEVKATSSGATNGAATVASMAPKVDSRVSSAFNKIGCTITINSGVNYDGLFDARTRSITLRESGDTIYHELGHFVAFIANNYDRGSKFQGIFASEQSKYTKYNKAYVCSNSSEYFAESFKNYTLEPAALKASRPETYAAIEEALSMVTDTQVSRIIAVYSAIWK